MYIVYNLQFTIYQLSDVSKCKYFSFQRMHDICAHVQCTCIRYICITCKLSNIVIKLLLLVSSRKENIPTVHFMKSWNSFNISCWIRPFYFQTTQLLLQIQPKLLTRLNTLKKLLQTSGKRW